MIEKIGACKFCGQNHMVRVHEEETKEDIIREATRICSCDDARAFQEVETNINITKQAIEESIAGDSKIKRLLLAAVQDVGSGVIDNLTIKKDRTTFTLKRTGKGSIKFEIKTVTVEVKES